MPTIRDYKKIHLSWHGPHLFTDESLLKFANALTERDKYDTFMNEPGIYAFKLRKTPWFSDDKYIPIYIGQSKRVGNRIMQHTYAREKQANPQLYRYFKRHEGEIYFWYAFKDEEQLKDAERGLLHDFRPRFGIKPHQSSYDVYVTTPSSWVREGQ